MKLMTQEVEEKLNREVSDLKREMGMFRSFLIGALVKEKEGEYRPEFVKKILRLSKEKAELSFKDAKTFLAQIQKSS